MKKKKITREDGIDLDFLFFLRNELKSIYTSMGYVYRVLNRCKVISVEERELFFSSINKMIKTVEDRIEQSIYNGGKKKNG